MKAQNVENEKQKIVGLTDKQVSEMIDCFIGYFCDDSATYNAACEWQRTENYLTDVIKSYLSRQSFDKN